MANRVRAVTFAMLIATVTATSAQNFECAPLQPSTARTPAYAKLPGQPRCEGFYERSVSQPFVELVSLTRGPAPAALAPARTFEIHAEVRAPLRLVVRPQRSSPFYRVDAALQGGQVWSWDPGPMLAATGLRVADLGFVALSASSPAAASTGISRVAPVALTAQARQAARVHAVVRVSVAVASVAWRGYRLGTDTASDAAWTELPDSQLYAWQRITLPIDLPADGGGLHVDVQAVGAGDGRSLPLLRFEIVGTRDAAPVR